MGFLKMPEYTDEELDRLSTFKSLKEANYKYKNKDTIEVSYKYKYSGTLEFYHETGMECQASIVHDDRGWREEPDFNNSSKKWDGPLKKFKSLEWGVFLKGGEYLKVFKDKKIIWEGILIRDILKIKEKAYYYGFIPKGIAFEDWCLWCYNEYQVEVSTNTPVLAEDEKYIKEHKNDKV